MFIYEKIYKLLLSYIEFIMINEFDEVVIEILKDYKVNMLMLLNGMRRGVMCNILIEVQYNCSIFIVDRGFF